MLPELKPSLKMLIGLTKTWAWQYQEILLLIQMFASLAAQETLLQMQIFLHRCKRMFLNQIKNIFASWNQILHPKQNLARPYG